MKLCWRSEFATARRTASNTGVTPASREPGLTPAFDAVRPAVANSLRQQSFITAARQYLQLLAGAATIEGVDLEGAATPLVQ